MRIDARNLAEMLTETIAHSASVLADRIALRLPRNSRRERAILARCRATTESGAQCKRRPIPDSAYCHQHRNLAKSDGRLFIVIEARDKAAKMTNEISRKTRTAAILATTRLAALSPTLRAEEFPREGFLGMRRFARRAAQSLRMQSPWVTAAVALIFIAVASIGFLMVANVDLRSLTGSSGDISPPSPTGGESESSGGQEVEASSNSGLFAGEDIYAPGADFRGAYVSGVEHLSNDSSMLEIYVPAGVEGDYHAVVTASEGLEFQCVILHHYTDRLYCIGARLLDGSQVNVRIFKIEEGQASQYLVFETDYTIGETVPPPQPTQPAFVPYGGGFTWPDRFDDIERQREQESTSFLWPLSMIMGGAASWLLMRVRRDIGQTKRLFEHGAPNTVA